MNLDKLVGRRILITGGAGFIGSNLAIRLVELGAHVTILDSMIPEYGGNIFNLAPIQDKIRLNFSDVRSEHSLPYLIKDQDFLFNLAGQTSHMDSMTDPQTDLDINCRSQLSILEVCRRVNPNIRLIFASTRQLYGRPAYLPVDEHHPLRPVDVNGINKLAGEFYHLLYSDVYGIPSTVLRLTNTYGPRMRIRDARQTFVGIWIRKVLEGQPFEVWGGEQKRDFTFVDDCVDALLLAATSNETIGKCYNIGGVEPVTLSQLAQLLVHTNGGGEFVIREFPADRKKIDIGDYYSNDMLFRRSTTWTPSTQLEKGLRITLDYFRENYHSYA
jgi:UDP-glucose 4-epimerase